MVGRPVCEIIRQFVHGPPNRHAGAIAGAERFELGAQSAGKVPPADQVKEGSLDMRAGHYYIGCNSLAILKLDAPHFAVRQQYSLDRRVAPNRAAMMFQAADEGLRE